MTLAAGFNARLDIVPAAGGEYSRPSRHLGGYCGIGGHPVCQRVLAVLDDGLAGLVTVVGGPRLAWRDGCCVDQLQEVLSVASNNGDLLAMLAEGIELVGVGGLYLLSRNVGQLRLGDQ